MLVVAIVLISFALIAYTSGVFAERRSGNLRPWHAALFGIGLVFDASGTFLMGRIADSGQTYVTSVAGTWLTSVMAVTGAAALIVMALHLAWALAVLWCNRDDERRAFHRLSLGVWLLWLVPYFTGMASAMVR